ncbi:peptidoglycan DD-metalloendopeptidase family protein [Maricurvus nonylphenolicus]|uniref:peptidoglycan DD-metalloendopeptidase family protein n=1 Tax=Maricurvus nonylphenolicus TaxID=1008307 RepID=UPI0036F3D3B1
MKRTSGQRNKRAKVINILIAFLVLSACSSAPHHAPVADRRQPPSDKLTHHVVSKGETMFSIAWRYGIDYKTLARYNGIARPYTIYPGQRLRLHSSRVTYKSPVKSVTKTAPKTPVSRSKTPTKTVVKKPSSAPSYSSFKWRWPAKGKLINGFSTSKGLNKGVDIAGRLGESVSAAGPGVVVYAGNGLRGYGNLLIIKHNEKFLSAYAHNHRLLVAEGNQIKAGQKIAEIGSSGTDQTKLHFEIRRDGKPVDPLRYLPKR